MVSDPQRHFEKKMFPSLLKLQTSLNPSESFRTLKRNNSTVMMRITTMPGLCALDTVIWII